MFRVRLGVFLGFLHWQLQKSHYALNLFICLFVCFLRKGAGDCPLFPGLSGISTFSESPSHPAGLPQTSGGSCSWWKPWVPPVGLCPSLSILCPSGVFLSFSLLWFSLLPLPLCVFRGGLFSTLAQLPAFSLLPRVIAKGHRIGRRTLWLGLLQNSTPSSQPRSGSLNCYILCYPFFFFNARFWIHYGSRVQGSHGSLLS